MPKRSNDMTVGRVHQSAKSGQLEIVHYVDARTVTIRFIDTGYETTTSVSQIRSGQIKDRLKPSVAGVGFLGGSATDKTSYTLWMNMINRCYANCGNPKYRCYADCTVDELWHNYQNFRTWFIDNAPDDYSGRTHQLDKDLKAGEIKRYGPDVCLIVPNVTNAEARKLSRYTLTVSDPMGAEYTFKSITQGSEIMGCSVELISLLIRGPRKCTRSGWTLIETERVL